MKKVRLLNSGAGDWRGLYVDNKLVMEGHSIRLENAIGYLVENIDFKSIDDNKEDYLERFGGHCPPEWQDEFDAME